MNPGGRENASIPGMIADPGISAYVAAKHAVIGLSKAAAIDCASEGIHINTLAPGLVETGMTRHWSADDDIRTILLANSPMGRFAQPGEIADIVLFGFSLLCRRSSIRRGWRIYRPLNSASQGFVCKPKVP